MLLKLTNRWRSRSDTFNDIYISLSFEFIEEVKLLFRFLISWLVLELWPRNWTPMSEFSDFWGVFRPSWPSQKKIQNLAGQTLTTTVSEVSRKFGWNRLARFGEFLLKKINRRKIESHTLRVRQKWCVAHGEVLTTSWDPYSPWPRTSHS